MLYPPKRAMNQSRNKLHGGHFDGSGTAMQSRVQEQRSEMEERGRGMGPLWSINRSKVEALAPRVNPPRGQGGGDEDLGL